MHEAEYSAPASTDKVCNSSFHIHPCRE